MSDEIFGQCATLIGHAAIQKDLLAAPIPTGDDVNKSLIAKEDGSVGWGHSALSDDELLSVLIDADIIAGVADASGAILTDENGKILLM